MRSTVKMRLGRVCSLFGAPEELLSDLREAASAPNPEFVDRKRLGLWLGGTPERVSLFGDEEDGWVTVPRGLASLAERRASELGFSLEIDDGRLFLPRVRFRFHGALREYQERAVLALGQHAEGVLEAPCGSGKTAMGMALIAARSQPALVLAHTKDLVKQLVDACRRWLDVEPGFIGDGEWRPSAPVTVGMVQSLLARPEGTAVLAREVGTLLLDEAHHCPARTFSTLVQAFPAVFRYGLTATPRRRDGLEPFLFAVMGPLRARVTNGDLERAGVLVRPRLEWVMTGFLDESDEYSSLISALVRDGERNAILLSVAERLIRDGRRLLVLSERVEHCDMLWERLDAVFPGRIRVSTGRLPKKKRNGALEDMRSGNADCLVASGIADEGLDLPELDALLLATPSRSGTRGRQRLGRVMRVLTGKRQPLVVDVADPCVGIFWSQARGRYYDVYRDLVENPHLPEWLKKGKAVAA